MLNETTIEGAAAVAQRAGVHLNFLERLWERYYNYMDNDIIATGLLLLVVHETVYFGRSLPWVILDNMPSMRKYKIQDQKVPSKAQYLECLSSVMYSHIFVEAVPIFGFHFVCSFFNISYRAPFPSLWTMFYQLCILFLIEDTWHYWGHRLLHTRYLYKTVHKQHHKYAAPFGLTAEYAHPVEVAFTGTGTVGSPLLLAYLSNNMHLLTVMTWITMRLFQAIDAHSGYEFPVSLHHFLPFWAGADHHDDHHHYFTGNFASSFRHWDYFMGTETAATTRRRAEGGHRKAGDNADVQDPDDKLIAEEKARAAKAAAAARTSGAAAPTATKRAVAAQ